MLTLLPASYRPSSLSTSDTILFVMLQWDQVTSDHDRKVPHDALADNSEKIVEGLIAARQNCRATSPSTSFDQLISASPRKCAGGVCWLSCFQSTGPEKQEAGHRQKPVPSGSAVQFAICLGSFARHPTGHGSSNGASGLDAIAIGVYLVADTADNRRTFVGRDHFAPMPLLEGQFLLAPLFDVDDVFQLGCVG
jgi:hypothetical protein